MSINNMIILLNSEIQHENHKLIYFSLTVFEIKT